MRHRFDQLGKQIGLSALGPCGLTVAHDEIAPDAYHADLRHEPDPARGAERALLGLLGRLAAIPCLIEIYGHAPSAEEFRACLGKHIAFWQQRSRKARAGRKTKKGNGRAPALEPEPFLWIIAAGIPVALQRELALKAEPGWPSGAYFFGKDVLRVGLIVASELPRDRATILVRLMAAGPLLPQAIADLAALPAGAHERTVAKRILLNMKHALGAKPRPTPEEQEFIVAIYDYWEQARRQGLKEGRAEAAARALLTVLRTRGIAVPKAARAQILAQQDRRCLERWLKRAAVASSLGEVIDEPS